MNIQDVVLYSNGGGPQDAWRPVITTAPSTVVPGNTYSVSGTLFNGFSEGASYGDDAQMSTNYPLVRIINHATGHVLYAHTHNHSRMGVEAVGSGEIITTQFDVPAERRARRKRSGCGGERHSLIAREHGRRDINADTTTKADSNTAASPNTAAAPVASRSGKILIRSLPASS